MARPWWTLQELRLFDGVLVSELDRVAAERRHFVESAPLGWLLEMLGGPAHE